MKTPFEQNEFDRMRNDPDNYKWGIFYFNPRDRRLILPKRNFWLGWTFNFASPYAYLLLLGIIVLAALLENI